MNFKMLPTEIKLLVLSDPVVMTLKPVRSLDIYDGATQNFHEDGLYSTSIFGRVGSEERDQRFSYIDIKAKVLHPKIFRDLTRLKGLYRGILQGKETAVFDEQAKDFVASNGPDAQTGYSFFIANWLKIEFRKNKSPTRQQRVEFIEKYRAQALTDRIVVIPAGLRDLEVDDGGRQSKNEINDLYFRLLSISNTIIKNRDMESPALDVPRYALTNCFAEIYTMLEAMIEGKKGFMLDKWGSRRIYNGTRNVLSVMDTSSARLGALNAPSYDSTMLGLFQTIKGLGPLTIHLLRNSYLANVFSEGDSSAPLIDTKTLLPELVSIAPATRDKWTTKEGLLSIINSFADKEARHRHVMVEGRYLALIYKGPDMTFKIFGDIRELPPHLDKKHVSPITLCELLYLSGYNRWNRYYVSCVRYPVTGVNSVYSSRTYVKTTTIGEVRRELDNNWMPTPGDDALALEFPLASLPAFFDTQAPHSSRLVGLGADFDGDTGSATFLMSEEATEENRKYLSTRQAWISTDGSLRASASYDTVALVVHNLTRR